MEKRLQVIFGAGLVLVVVALVGSGVTAWQLRQQEKVESQNIIAVPAIPNPSK